MSIAEFSDAFKNKIFTDFNSLSRNQKALAIKDQDTKDLRRRFESATSGASSVFTGTGIANVLSSIAKNIDNAKLAEYAESVINRVNYSEFLSFVKASSYASKIEEFEGGFNLSKVPQKTLRELFLQYIEIIISTTNSTLGHELYDYIASHIESGHLAGVFSPKLLRNLPVEASVTGPGYRDFTISSNDGTIGKTEQTLEVIIKALLDADYLTSNVVDREEVFIKASKSVLSDNPHLEVELQFKKDNKASGDLLQKAGDRLNKLLSQLTAQQLNNNDADTAFKQFVASFKPLSEMLIARSKQLNQNPVRQGLAEDILSNAQSLNALANTLINTKGSPSMVESILLSMSNSLEGKPKLQPINTSIRQVTKYQDVDSVTSQINKAIKAATKEVTKLKNSKKKTSLKVNAVPTSQIVTLTYSLANLQLLLNTHLQDVVSANMGDGTRKDVLNYQTGRFAASVKVDRLSQSREGMITAFYSYMKNPYQTFEPGYRQGAPKTRDPKLLIAKSIRDIAATKVSNRMRAVSA